MLARLREEVLEANLEIVRRGLVLYTFGNVVRDQPRRRPRRHQAERRRL